MVHILVIDDDDGIRKLLSRVLGGLGYEVKSARDGKDGIGLFNSGHNFNLVITDIRMPEMNGNEVAKCIRASQRPETPVVAITGYSKEADKELFDFMLEKPFDLKALMKVVGLLV